MLDWRVYYGDGSTFSNEDGTPEQAPGLDVQFVAVRDPELGKRILANRDFYIFRDGEWRMCDFFGLVDNLVDMGIVKAGRTIGTEKYKQIFQEVLDDTDFPPKSGQLPESFEAGGI